MRLLLYRPVWLGVVILGPFFVSTLAVQNKTTSFFAKRFDYPTAVLFSGNKEHGSTAGKNAKATGYKKGPSMTTVWPHRSVQA